VDTLFAVPETQRRFYRHFSLTKLDAKCCGPELAFILRTITDFFPHRDKTLICPAQDGAMARCSATDLDLFDIQIDERDPPDALTHLDRIRDLLVRCDHYPSLDLSLFPRLVRLYLCCVAYHEKSNMRRIPDSVTNLTIHWFRPAPLPEFGSRLSKLTLIFPRTTVWPQLPLSSCLALTELELFGFPPDAPVDGSWLPPRLERLEIGSRSDKLKAVKNAVDPNHPLDTEVAVRLCLSKLPSLRSLTIRTVTVDGIQWEGPCASLRQLALHATHPDAKVVGWLSQAVRQCRNLVQIQAFTPLRSMTLDSSRDWYAFALEFIASQPDANFSWQELGREDCSFGLYRHDDIQHYLNRFHAMACRFVSLFGPPSPRLSVPPVAPVPSHPL
jgi:hypothetical protein